MVNNQRPAFWAKAFYFCFYAAAAALFPFLVLYYDSLGLSGYQIGLLAGILPLVTLFSAPLWGGLADRSQRHRSLLLTAIFTTILTVFLLSKSSAFIWLIPLVVIFAFFIAPIMPIVDNSVMELIADQKDRYGKLRLWGSIGWGVASPFIGWFIERSGLSWAFYGYMILMSASLLIAVQLTVSQAGIGSKFWVGLRSLLSNPGWALFLFAVFVFGFGSAVINNYLFLYMDDLGASKTLMGLSLMFATISEVPVLYFSGRLLNRFGYIGMMIFAMSLLAIRLLAYSLIQNPFLVLFAQLLHGPAYSALWVSGVFYAANNAPRGLGATAQGLFAGVLLGLSAAVGAFAGGILYENIGSAAMFRLVGFFVVLGTGLFLLVGRRKLRMESPAI
ncbi:MAG: major facilitator superfamily domain-containing protein 6 [Chloroflexota bacterium]|nr:major facilitator superfamily domain-containing protein 6 [Chloroflexota bacterium]